MKSVQTKEFREFFEQLPQDVQKQARKANRLFEERIHITRAFTLSVLTRKNLAIPCE